jgi:hypothetical protein
MNEQQQLIEIAKEVSPVLLVAQRLEINNATDYHHAGEFLKEVKAAKKKFLDFFAPIKKKTYEAWKSIVARETEMVSPLDLAESSVKQKMLSYQRQEELKRRQEQQRLQAEADARAAKERERLRKQAGKLKTPELREQRLAEAEEIDAPLISLQTETPKIQGISTRKLWRARVDNKNKFVNAALDNENLMAFISIDESRLNKIAQATKGEVKYPGVVFYHEESLAAGTK